MYTYVLFSTTVMGMTDIDDKIITRARERGTGVRALARQCEDEFMQDMRRLNVRFGGGGGGVYSTVIYVHTIVFVFVLFVSTFIFMAILFTSLFRLCHPFCLCDFDGSSVSSTLTVTQRCTVHEGAVGR